MILALVGSLLSALPLPDYEQALLSEAEQEVDQLVARGKVSEASEFLTRFRTHVADDARLIYSQGLTQRLLGNPEEAKALLEESLLQDPELAQSWYDLGEVLLVLDVQSEAESAFKKASQLSIDHPNGWAAPFRLAELAGEKKNTAAFEGWLEEAIRRGFSFQQIVWGSEKWAKYLSDPELGDIMKRLITVHEDESILESWPPALER